MAVPNSRFPRPSVWVHFVTFAAALLVCPGSAGAADGRELEGGGLATVVAGNVVSAKQRAVQRAQRDLLEQALSLLIDDVQRLRLASRIEAKVLAQPTLYLRGYRLIHEEQFEDVFSVRVAARCDLTRLRKAVLSDTVQKASSSGQRQTLTVDLRLVMPRGRRSSVFESQTRGLVRGQLERAGFALQFGAVKPSSPLAARPIRAVAGVSLRFDVKLSAAPAIRGLGWYAAQAAVAVTARFEGTILGSWDSVQWASEPTSWRGAAARALDRALVVVLGPCVAALEDKRAAGRGREMAAYRLIVEGAPRLATVLALCGWVRDGGFGVCRVDRLARGAVQLEIRNGVATELLASALERADFDDADLVVVGRGKQFLRVRMSERGRPLPGDSAGGRPSDEVTGHGP